MTAGDGPFTDRGTLGIEEEFYVVDDEARPTSGTDELVYGSDPPAILGDRLDHELFKCVIETQTPTLDGLGEAEAALAEVRGALAAHAGDHGYRIASAGLHPAARWRELEHAEKPRYRSQLDRIQYPQHRNTTAGLHVHVGVDDPDAAVWVANELRWHLPVLLALSANSPYWCGFDTGLQSARSIVFENLPNTGMPTAFGGYADYLDLESTMLETDAIADRGELWWDVRPHTAHGTVEVRTPDAQADPERVLALVEYVHALVLERLEAYEAASDPWSRYHRPRDARVGDAPLDARADAAKVPRHELLVENKWRAVRYGRDAAFVDPDGEGETPFERVVERDVERLGLERVPDLLAAESGAERQRRLRADAGMDRLCESIVLEQDF